MGRVKVDPKKIEAMKIWPPPKNIKELRGFLGLTEYYKRFVVSYGQIAHLLTDYLRMVDLHGIPRQMRPLRS